MYSLLRKSTPKGTGLRRPKPPSEMELFCEEIRLAFFDVDIKNLVNESEVEYYLVKTYEFVDKGQGPKLYDQFREIVEEYVEIALIPAIRYGSKHDGEKITELKDVDINFDFITVLMCFFEDYVLRVETFAMLEVPFVKDDKHRDQYKDFIGFEEYAFKICRKKILHVVKDKMENAFSTLLKPPADELKNRLFIERQFSELKTSTLWTKCGLDEIFKQLFDDFVDDLKHHYRQEKAKLLKDNNERDQILMVELNLTTRDVRFALYFDAETRALLARIAEEELIFMDFDKIVTEPNICRILGQENQSQLFMIYRLLGRCDKDEVLLTKMFNIVFDYFYDKNRQLIDDLRTPGGCEVNSFIHKLIKFVSTYDAFLEENFGKDIYLELASFLHADKVFFEVVNNQEKSAELLSGFIDNKLQLTTKETEEEDRKLLLSTVFLLQYLGDKEDFLRHYYISTSRRILNERAMSDSLEMFVFQQVQREFGIRLAYSLERITKDYFFFKDIPAKFEAYVQENNVSLSVPLSVRVFSLPLWKNNSPMSPLRLPQNMVPAFQEFRKFFAARHPGPNLTLWHAVGVVTLSAWFVVGDKEVEYFITMSTYQAAILLLFNGFDCLTLEDIQKETDISQTELISSITPLISYRILLMDSEVLANQSEIAINKNFSWKIKDVMIPFTSARQQTKASGDAKPDPEASLVILKNQIDAVILRVMKARKTMTIVELIGVVLDQVSTHFPLNPAIIHDRVDALVKRKFLDTEDSKVYDYVIF